MYSCTHGNKKAKQFGAWLLLISYPRKQKKPGDPNLPDHHGVSLKVQSTGYPGGPGE
jgi:hypothetical protein